MAVQAGLCLSWLETPEDMFSHDGAHLYVFSDCFSSIFGDDDDNVAETLGIKPKSETEPDAKKTGDVKKGADNKTAEKLLNDEVHISTYIVVSIVFVFTLVLDCFHEKLFYGRWQETILKILLDFYLFQMQPVFVFCLEVVIWIGACLKHVFSGTKYGSYILDAVNIFHLDEVWHKKMLKLGQYERKVIKYIMQDFEVNSVLFPKL